MKGSSGENSFQAGPGLSVSHGCLLCPMGISVQGIPGEAVAISLALLDAVRGA